MNMMSSRHLFDPPRSLFPKRQVHQLKNMKIREISAVDAPASPGAEIILMKGLACDGSSMTVSFEPIFFHKTFKRADAEHVDEAPTQALTKAEPVGIAARERFRRRRLKKSLFKNAVASDADALVAQALGHSPVASETYEAWLRRVFRGTLSGFDLKLAKALYDLLMKAAGVRTMASEALEKMARIRAAEAGVTFEKAYASVATSETGKQLYELIRAKLIPPPFIAKRATNAQRYRDFRHD